MKLDALTAVSPIDGRYRSKTQDLASYFSEYALIKYRVRVEIEYFITLCELPLRQTFCGANHADVETASHPPRRTRREGIALAGTERDGIKQL